MKNPLESQIFYEVVLIGYLAHVRSDMKIGQMTWQSIEEMEMKLRKYETSELMEYLPMEITDSFEPGEYVGTNYMDTISNQIKDMIEANDCYLATKLSRALFKLFGKFFQGIANPMIA